MLSSLGPSPEDELSESESASFRPFFLSSSSIGKRLFKEANFWIASATEYLVCPHTQASISSGLSWVCRKRWSLLSDSNNAFCRILDSNSLMNALKSHHSLDANRGFQPWLVINIHSKGRQTSRQKIQEKKTLFCTVNPRLWFMRSGESIFSSLFSSS